MGAFSCDNRKHLATSIIRRIYMCTTDVHHIRRAEACMYCADKEPKVYIWHKFSKIKTRTWVVCYRFVTRLYKGSATHPLPPQEILACGGSGWVAEGSSGIEGRGHWSMSRTMQCNGREPSRSGESYMTTSVMPSWLLHTTDWYYADVELRPHCVCRPIRRPSTYTCRRFVSTS